MLVPLHYVVVGVVDGVDGFFIAVVRSCVVGVVVYADDVGCFDSVVCFFFFVVVRAVVVYVYVGCSDVCGCKCYCSWRF